MSFPHSINDRKKITKTDIHTNTSLKLLLLFISFLSISLSRRFKQRRLSKCSAGNLVKYEIFHNDT